MLSFGPTEACRHAICESWAERRGIPYGMATHVAELFLSLSDACSNASQISINRRRSVRMHLIKLVSNTGAGFQLYRPQNAIHFLPHGEHLFSRSKTERLNSQLSNAAHMRLEYMILTTRKNWESYHTKWTSSRLSCRK